MYSPMTDDNQNNKMIIVPVILIALVAFVGVAIIDIGSDDNNGLGQYYFSGEITEALTDANGITDEDYEVRWVTEKNVCGYAIVDEYAYVVYRAGSISKVDLKDGTIVATVMTEVPMVNDHPAVGGGMLLEPNTGRVFDLDLNELYTIDSKSWQAQYDNGCWYMVKRDKTCVCYDAEDQDPSVPNNVQTPKWTSKFTFFLDGYTLPISMAMNDKYIFYPGIGESDASARILYCVSKETGEQVDSYIMTDIRGTMWNSGFIYCEGNTIAVTTHWDSMFTKPRLGEYKTIFLIDVGSDGKFLTDTATYMTNGYDDSYGSCLVMKDGLGYIQSGQCFNVIDLKTKKIIAQTERDGRLLKTYSNIAITINGDRVCGYVSPAGVPEPLVYPVDGLIGFEYDKKTNDIRIFSLPVEKEGTNNTYSVKIGPNGEILFTKNDAKLYCLTAKGTDQ